MKLWRRAAASVKRQQVAKGLHVKGMRYGRAIKAIGSVKIKAIPSPLFINLAIEGGYIKEA